MKCEVLTAVLMKTQVLLDHEVVQRLGGTCCFPLDGSPHYSEDGVSKLLRNVAAYIRSTLRQIPEDWNLQHLF
jgi:hypothetical protein